MYSFALFSRFFFRYIKNFYKIIKTFIITILWVIVHLMQT